MSDRATIEAEHRSAFSAVGMTYRVLDIHREAFDRLIRSVETMESAGIVIDPTLLRDYVWSKSAQAQVRMARLVLRFLADMGKEIDALPAGAAESAT